MRYLTPCDFYTYKNDRIKIRDLLIKERTLDEFSKMNESDIVDPNIAIILCYIGYEVGPFEYNSYTFSMLSTIHTVINAKEEIFKVFINFTSCKNSKKRCGWVN